MRKFDSLVPIGAFFSPDPNLREALGNASQELADHIQRRVVMADSEDGSIIGEFNPLSQDARARIQATTHALGRSLSDERYRGIFGHTGFNGAQKGDIIQ